MRRKQEPPDPHEALDRIHAELLRMRRTQDEIVAGIRSVAYDHADFTVREHATKLLKIAEVNDEPSA